MVRLLVTTLQMPSIQTRLFFRMTVKSLEVYLLKILSLAVAFACTTLITIFAMHEFGYDRFHNSVHQVFRILEKNNGENYNGNRLSNKIPSAVFSALRDGTSGSAIVSRLKLLDGIDVLSKGKTSLQQKIHAADTNIAGVFTIRPVHGTNAGFKNNPHSVMISVSAALKYFGITNAVGEKIRLTSLGDTVTCTVAMVFRDFPDNSHEHFDFFIPFDSATLQTLHFNTARSAVYLRVSEAQRFDYDSLQRRLSASEQIVYQLQPLSQIYFGPRVLGEDTRHGDRYSITILIAITVLIIFLALTTFINLTTLTLPHRAKEIAVKKLAGIRQLDLIISFVLESLAIVGISSVMGLILLVVASGFFEKILAVDPVSLLLNGNIEIILIWTLFILAFTMSPVFMVFRFTGAAPTQLLSSEVISFPQLKKVIIFLQMGISIFLIVASLVIKRQIDYSLLKEPGRNHDQVVYLDYPPDLTDHGLRSLRKAWKEYHPNILDVIGTTKLPNNINSKDVNSPFYFMSVDPAFIDFFKLNMVAGQWFKANDGDSIYVVNERGSKTGGVTSAHVIGVFKDISDSFNQPEKPVRINIAPYYNYNYICIRILEVDIRRTVGYLSNYFARGNNKASVSYLDKNFERWLLYQDGLNSLSGVLAIISGVLSCFAIYGLSLSIVRDKMKQIALHKLFGATTFRITQLLVQGFTRQVVIALLIFGPVSYLILKELLRTFVYATSFQWQDAAIPVSYCVVVIILLCGFQAKNLHRQDLSASLRG